MKRNDPGHIENLIEFETGPRPLVTKSNYPYGKIMDGLKALDSTKSLVFDKAKFGNNRLQTLRNIAKKGNLGYIKQCRKGEKVYVWLQEPINGGGDGKVL